MNRKKWNGGERRKGNNPANDSREIPVPPLVREAIKVTPNRLRHPGLLLDKFLSPCKDQEEQKKEAEKICGCPGFATELEEEWCPRREALLKNTVSLRWTRKVGPSPLTLHLSRASILENAGLCLHRVYGFPYFPGAGLKGMAQAFAKTVWLPAQVDKKEG